jgi:Dipeptidyl aminopeptidases/acylaminoacyl-peptidases
MFLNEELEKRNIPDILTNTNWDQRRIEILDILAREEYGFSPIAPFNVTSEIISYTDKDIAAKVSTSHVKIKVETDEGLFTFPVYQFVPNNVEKPPVLLHIAFRDDIPDQYMPVEEIIDNGFALVMFCYNDITLDKQDNFKSGVASMYSRKKYSWGKIAMWAWAASRVMDYLQTYTRLDLDNVAVVGHSRLGKTALWCGANDTRFKYVFANNSGCSGDAVTRGKTGERVAEITKNFDYWFCDGYKKYIGKEDDMPFDQHFLVASIAPRFVYCGAAVEDTWADPYSQFLSYYSASEVYESLGLKGLSCEDKYPEIGDTFADGDIGYHLRSGSHFLSRYDWNRYMEFMKSKMN